MAVTAAGFLDYLGENVDLNAEDLIPFLAAAKSKARTAGIKDFKNNAQYDGFIYALAGMLYDNRDMAFSGAYQATAEANARALINSYVLELRYATEDPEPGGGVF